MNRSNSKLKLAAALSLALAALPALAQQQEKFKFDYADDQAFTFIEAEVDYTAADGGQLRWDAELWHGGDYQKWYFLTDGEREDGEIEEAGLQVLYGRYLAPFWDWRAGLRHDFEPDSLNYAVLGVKGFAPYRFEVDASLFLSEDGDLSAGFEAEYAVLFTQRLIAEPYLDLEVFAQDVPELGRGAGLSEATVGLRVRYEIKREFAPYVDVSYTRLTGETADLARDAGEDVEEAVVRAGLRVWF